MPTRNVVLTEQQHQLINDLVHTGRYQNASEVLREGLRLIERREQEHELRLAALRESVLAGATDIESGRSTKLDRTDIDDFVMDLSQEAAREAKRK